MKKLMSVISKLYAKFFVPKHLFPVGCLVHPRNGSAVFEIEFNWYDEDMQPVSVVRQVSNQQIASIRHSEMKGFKEYSGKNEMLGSNVHLSTK